MKRKMKWLSVILSVCLIAALFAGCGESGGSSAAPAKTETKSEAAAPAATETKSEAAAPAATETKSEAPAATETKSEAPAAEPSGDVLKLSFSHHDAATSVWGLFFEEWAQNVKEASDGECEITVYAGATLAAPSDGLQALRTGVCDILWTNMAFYPGQFPVTDGTILPFYNNGATAGQATAALWDLWEDPDVGPLLQDEWGEFKMLILHGSPGFPLGLTEEGRTPEDVAGRTLRCPAGGLTDLYAECGANPVLTPSGDIYTSMDKGIIEGYTIDFAGIKGFKLEEVTNYAVDLNSMNQWMCILMTKEKWESLPDKVKAAMEQYSGREASIAFADRTQEDSDAMKKVFEDSGRLIVPTEDEMAQWEEVGKVVQQNWIDANAGSFDSQLFYDKLGEYIDKETN